MPLHCLLVTTDASPLPCGIPLFFLQHFSQILAIYLFTFVRSCGGDKHQVFLVGHLALPSSFFFLRQDLSSVTQAGEQWYDYS